ncbi:MULTISPECIES: sensor histidine kinase [unclassified Variovorax]|uniref:sensor histidine kinase n=1 Tax=unclassified Variovorax TaxID=663243 RepID=UPI00076CFD6D|nr:MULTISPECIES: sensor histidine kinase [unclassified Variovorax]KWT78955.1 histidine kinase [Variovorax sp. WDL1]PNG59437.1 Sensor protein TorS [Variovorax sp. B4]PNG60772.1 Sensor protein TorS [Variovorax sp. B2]VTV13313.1 Sensor protein TorS [Variovorax sp. WDL1]
MHRFLYNNRDELIERCKAKVAQRPRRAATAAQLANGVPMFLDQLMRALEAQENGEFDESFRISGATGGHAGDLSEMGRSAAAHGKELLKLGFSVDQVVHDYGDLCQAITDLAVERDAPFSVDEFRTLNRCLDNAIADAVTEFGASRDASVALQQTAEENERLGMLVHELRNYLHTATLAFAALEAGKVPFNGATGAVLKRSLNSLAALLSLSLSQVRGTVELTHEPAFSVASFVAEARNAAALDASAKGCTFSVLEVDAALGISGNRERLLAALVNLLQNAFKFTHAHTEVALSAYAEGDEVLFDVKDQCGGLPPGAASRIFQPFVQVGDNKSGLGLGLSIARRNVVADGGSLTVRDVPGTGCVFTIKLPRRTLA